MRTMSIDSIRNVIATTNDQNIEMFSCFALVECAFDDKTIENNVLPIQATIILYIQTQYENNQENNQNKNSNQNHTICHDDELCIALNIGQNIALENIAFWDHTSMCVCI